MHFLTNPTDLMAFAALDTQDHFVDMATTCDRSLNLENGHHVYKVNESDCCDQWWLASETTTRSMGLQAREGGVVGDAAEVLREDFGEHGFLRRRGREQRH